MRSWPLVVALVACGCKKRDPVTRTGGGEVVETPIDGSVDGLVSPGRWTDGEFAVVVPLGWSGVQGDGPRRLSLVDETTGVAFEVWAFGEPLDGPRVDPADVCDFVDRQQHRAVPGLGHTHTATCVGPDATRQSWWAISGAVEVHVEVTTPLGRAVRGRQEVASLLRDFSRVR